MKKSRNNILNSFIKLVLSNFSNTENELAVLNTVFNIFISPKLTETGKDNDLSKILQSFEFSLDEFTPSQDSLTPEIFGIIYETIQSQRKNNGVFYTPKHIVLYMCRESLNNYLKKILTIEEDVIKNLESGKVTSKQALIIDNALTIIKICDPAVGCGVFAVGIVHEISRLRHILSPYINQNRTLYELKKHAIENSIFGADIDGVAVDIVKKRLWLSLLSENKCAENLKNIKFNIVLGNSLTGDINFLNIQEYFDIVLANPPYIGEKGNKDLFQKIKNGHLRRFHQSKMDLFYFFIHLALNITKEKGEIVFITTNYFPTATGAQKLRRDLKERSIFKKIINFNDLKLFNSALGQNNMITFLQKGHNPKAKVQIISTRKKGFIEDATLHNILEFQDNETDYLELSQQDLYDGEEDYIRLYKVSSEGLSEGILIKMIQNSSVPLGEVCYIHQGLKTNADKVTQKHLYLYPELIKEAVKKDEGIFIIHKNHEIIKNFSQEERKFLKPFFKNCDIKRYFTNKDANEYVLFITKEDYISENDINIRGHLNRYKFIIQNRAEVEPYGGIPLYAITRPRKDYMYTGPKIVAPYKSKSNTFGYNECEWFASGDVYYINQMNNNFDLKYILALLNSKLYLFWLKLKGKRKGNLLELYQKPLSEIPIKITPKNDQNDIIVIVDKIIRYNHDVAMVNMLSKEIDMAVYKLFKLSDEEINTIENLT